MSSDVSNDWQVEVFYDGECPLCLREIKLLRRLDRKHRIRFTNIADPSFSPASYGMSMKDFMDEIQGRLPSGDWITGVEVFRRLYAAVGLRPVVCANSLARHFAWARVRLSSLCQEPIAIDGSVRRWHLQSQLGSAFIARRIR